MEKTFTLELTPDEMVIAIAALARLQYDQEREMDKGYDREDAVDLAVDELYK